MSQPRPAVRLAAPAEAAAISALLFEFNGEGLPPAVLAERLAAACGLETVFLAEWAGSAAGLAVLRTGPTISGPDDWAELSELYVRPGSRRRGLGRALVEAALDYARQRGCREVHLLVDPENAAALALYESLGFRRDSWDMCRRL
jgi:ribosomal protein S18 acetylase RimI-like enzyme